MLCFIFFFFKQKTAYEMRISDWSSDVCSSDLVDHAGDLLDMRLFRLDPQQVRAILERGDAIEHATVLTRPFAELIEVRRQPLRPHQLAVAVDDDVTVDRKSTRLNSSH